MATILRLPRVIERVQLSRSNIYAKINRREFPCAIPLGARAVGWLATDIDAWIDAQAALPRRYNTVVEVTA
jgi:prophage regulatory protein